MFWKDKELIYIVEIIVGIILLLLDIIIPLYFTFLMLNDHSRLYMIPFVCGGLFMFLPISLIIDGISEGKVNDMEVY